MAPSTRMKEHPASTSLPLAGDQPPVQPPVNVGDEPGINNLISAMPTCHCQNGEILEANIQVALRIRTQYEAEVRTNERLQERNNELERGMVALIHEHESLRKRHDKLSAKYNGLRQQTEALARHSAEQATLIDSLKRHYIELDKVEDFLKKEKETDRQEEPAHLQEAKRIVSRNRTL
ncbi:hypothetical protein NMY22_g7434 [Coprinellus aureogranulatus]|nr:hypothetical protein NMY22_g7434 [Coprinellus aureogranulatus]